MILLISLVAGVLAGWLLRGRVRNLVGLRLRGEGPLAAIVLATALIPRVFEYAGTRWHDALLIVWAVMMAVVLWLCWLNVRVPGAVLLGAGLLANTVVIVLNGGMPVAEQAVIRAGGGGEALSKLAGAAFHVPADGARLWWLGDVVPLSGLRAVLSPGDLAMGAGVAVLVAWGMRQGERGHLEAAHR
ncbi:MAG: hypothetical protein FDZ70_01660 [Actinobacteria bacterium]|nr:MAG: hypothetical protein FDZ70_01660 [Actinomycetota bacterium]